MKGWGRAPPRLRKGHSSKRNGLGHVESERATLPHARPPPPCCETPWGVGCEATPGGRGGGR